MYSLLATLTAGLEPFLSSKGWVSVCSGRFFLTSAPGRCRALRFAGAPPSSTSSCFRFFAKVAVAIATNAVYFQKLVNGRCLKNFRDKFHKLQMRPPPWVLIGQPAAPRFSLSYRPSTPTQHHFPSGQLALGRDFHSKAAVSRERKPLNHAKTTSNPLPSRLSI